MTEIATDDLHARQSRLEHIVADLLAEAKRQGASAAEAAASSDAGLETTVRLGEVETVEHTRDNGLGITVYFGHRKGSASTSDLSPEAIRDTVAAACAIAVHTQDDPCAGLADAASHGQRDPGSGPLQSVAGHGRGRHRPRHRVRGRGTRHGPPHRELRGRDRLDPRRAARLWQQPRLRRRLPQLTPWPVLRRRGPGGREHAAGLLVQLRKGRRGVGARRGDRPARQRAHRWPGSAGASSPPARPRCCSRRRWPPG